MTAQELATLVIVIVGGNAAVLRCAWKLSEKLIDTKLREQQSLFDHKLSKAHSLFTSRKQIFCERQEEAFAHTYSLLMDCHRKLFFLGKTKNLSEYKAAKPDYEALHNEASLYFLAKCFYFTPELLEATERLFTLYNDMAVLYGRGHQLEHHGTQYVIDVDTLKETKTEVDKILRNIRDLLYKTLSADGEPQ